MNMREKHPNEIEATRVFTNNDSPPHATPQMADLIAKVGQCMLSNDKRKLTLLRRKIRKRLFGIRDALFRGEEPSSEYDAGLRAWMELQFRDGKYKWYMLTNEDGKKSITGGFTFEWDVSVNEPLKLIEPIEWDGGIDRDLYERCGVRRCVPPAFTNQG